ncbi:hypothetical protein EDB80DRAFT_691180 [Ilyonectria destructans]|nr:hypothetical protein EDB80DRAFT_691180 [Ilyonectria destructans]
MASRSGTAMVIWAASASGRAVALNLAESGYSKLILVDECYNQLSVVATECQERALPEAAVLLLTCDFGNPQAINNLMIQAVEQAGRIDCVANCAPLDFCPRSTTDLSAQQLKMPGEGVWLWMREEVSQALSQSYSEKGSGRMSIVTMTTVHGFASEPGLPSYAVSSHGIVGMTKTTAMDYVTSGIRINCVCHYPVAPSASRTSEEFWQGHGPAPFGRHITVQRLGSSNRISFGAAVIRHHRDSFASRRRMVAVPSLAELILRVIRAL